MVVIKVSNVTSADPTLTIPSEIVLSMGDGAEARHVDHESEHYRTFAELLQAYGLEHCVIAKASDSTEGYREGLSEAEAHDVASGDTSLLHLVEPARRTARVTLTAYNMGDVTEADYDAWAAYVAEHIDEATGLDVEVDAARFAGAGQDRDIVTADRDEDAETVREALRTLWDRWCADGAPGVEA